MELMGARKYTDCREVRISDEASREFAPGPANMRKRLLAYVSGLFGHGSDFFVDTAAASDWDFPLSAIVPLRAFFAEFTQSCSKEISRWVQPVSDQLGQGNSSGVAFLNVCRVPL